MASEDGKVTFYPQILSESQQAVLPLLGKFASEQGFYLGGGTAVALYLGHRASIDFDWFRKEPISDPLVLAELLRQAGLRVEGVQTAPGTMHALADRVRVSFFEYPYDDIGDASVWSDPGIRLASLDDLAAMKLAAIAQRGSRKDFIDVFFLARAHKPVGEMIELYRRKYRIDDIGPVLVGFTYFDDADQEPAPVMLADIQWDQVKAQFQEWARLLAT